MKIKRLRLKMDHRAQALVEFALTFLVFLLLIFLIIEVGRLLYAYVMIQHAARTGARYAATGQLDERFEEGDPNCVPVGWEVLRDARTCSIEAVTEASMIGLFIDPNASEIEDYFYHSYVIGTVACDPANPPTDPDDPCYVETGTPPASAIVRGFGGMPGQNVVVRVEYRIAIITPVLSDIAPNVRLTSQAIMVNETFGAPGVQQASVPPPPLPPLPDIGDQCGDDTCQADEDGFSCYADCGGCGNAECETPNENDISCYADCGSCPDDICQVADEDPVSCPEDCGYCGDDECQSNEDDLSCYPDCGDCPDTICQPDELSNPSYTCPDDCGFCPDGICQSHETDLSCPLDCGAPPPPPPCAPRFLRAPMAGSGIVRIGGAPGDRIVIRDRNMLTDGAPTIIGEGVLGGTGDCTGWSDIAVSPLLVGGHVLVATGSGGAAMATVLIPPTPTGTATITITPTPESYYFIMTPSCGSAGTVMVTFQGYNWPTNQGAIYIRVDGGAPVAIINPPTVNWVRTVPITVTSAPTHTVRAETATGSSRFTLTFTVPCPPVCGDQTCDGGETAASCYADCGSCGDGECNVEEFATCAQDCYCGNGACQGSETAGTCPADCGPYARYVNVGACGEAHFEGHTWAANQPYTAATGWGYTAADAWAWMPNSGVEVLDLDGVTTIPEEEGQHQGQYLYLCRGRGTFTYRFDVPRVADYTVTLGFQEPVDQSNRSFSVRFEGEHQPRLSNWNLPAAAGGYYRRYDWTTTVHVTDGSLIISFEDSPCKQDPTTTCAVVSAISVVQNIPSTPTPDPRTPTATLTVTPSPTNTPTPTNLVIQSIQPAAPGPYRVFTPVVFNVTVQNTGGAAAANLFWVDLYVDPPTPVGPYIPQSYSVGYMGVSGLAGGATQTLAMTVPAFSTTGNHTIYAVVDSTNRIPESSETDNVGGPTAAVVENPENVTPSVTPPATNTPTGAGSIAGHTYIYAGEVWQTPTGRVQIVVKQGETVIRTTESATDGSYLVSNLSPGTYTVVGMVSVGGELYQDSRPSVVVVNGATTENVDLFLMKY